VGAEVQVLASHVVAAVVLTFLRLVAGVTGTAKAQSEQDCVKEATMAKARTALTEVGFAVVHSILETTLAAVICGVAQLAEHPPGA